MWIYRHGGLKDQGYMQNAYRPVYFNIKILNDEEMFIKSQITC